MDNGTFVLNGVTLGAGSYPLISAPTGVLSTPTIRTVDTPRPRSNGVIPGADFLAARTMTFEVAVLGSTPADAEQLTSALVAAFAPSADDVGLSARISGTPSEYWFSGRARGADVILDYIDPYLGGEATPIARCVFQATDPVRYGAEMTEEIGLATNHLPNDLPFILGYFDSETINSAGTTSVDRWSVEIEAINGGLVDPSITHVGSGQIVFHDLEMSDGDVLVVDGAERRAVLNGTTPVIPAVAQWWKVAPGNNEIRFAAGAASSLDSTATVTWRPGWA